MISFMIQEFNAQIELDKKHDEIHLEKSNLQQKIIKAFTGKSNHTFGEMSIFYCPSHCKMLMVTS